MTVFDIFVISCMIVLVAAQPHRTGAPGQGPGQRQASSGGTGSFPGRLAIAQYLGRPGGGTSTGGSGSSEGGGLGDILPLLMISGGDFGGNMLGGMALMQGLSGGGGGGREGGGRGGRGGMRSLMRSPFGLMGATGALGDNMQAMSMCSIVGFPMCLMMGNM